MGSGRIDGLIKDHMLKEALKSRAARPRKANPLVVALTIIGALTVAFALFYSFYNLISGNAYKDVDEDEEEFEEDENENA
ncbi:MAG: hypothetical protein K6G60_06345 [Lachnospiraceae bacterium]|nr:hypothetical protein [Lachnospiraceae bacterium]